MIYQPIIIKYTVYLSRIIIAFLGSVILLSGCVTQEYKDDNTPIVVNEANNKELALTRIQLGLGYLKIGNTTQAKLNLEKAKNFSPNLVQVHTAFAHYYEQVGEVEQAIQAYEKALSIKPDDADTLNNYGVFLCRQGRVDDAEKQLLKAIEVPSYLLVSKSYENIALCQLKANNFVKAELYLQKSIEHSPNNVSALVQMAQLQYAKKQYQKAATYIRRYEKATRHFQPVPLALAYKSYKKLGNSQAANNYAAMLMKMFPHSLPAKAFIKNGLAHIDADTLAEKYQQAMNNTSPIVAKKKRVVKLSPPKNIATQLTSVKQIPKSVVTKTTLSNSRAKNDKVAKDKLASSKNITEQIAVEPIIDKQALQAQINTQTNTQTNAKANTDNQLKQSNLDSAPESVKQNEMPINPTNDEITVEAEQVNVSVDENKSIQNVNNEDNTKAEEPTFHIIKSGENLFTVSKKYNIRLRSLIRWNNLPKNPVLHIGDKISLIDPSAKNADENHY